MIASLILGLALPATPPQDLGEYSDTRADLAHPVAATFGPNGTLYAVEAQADRVRAFDVDGGVVATYGGPGELSDPGGVAVAPDGRVFVADSGNHRIRVFGPLGEPGRTIGERGAGPGQLLDPRGLAVHDDTLIVADAGNDRIQVFSLDGEPRTIIGGYGAAPGRFNRPLDVAAGDSGLVFVADTGNHRIQKLGAGGEPIAIWGDFGPYVGQFGSPSGVDTHGGRVYVADRDNHRIQVFDGDGERLYQWGLHAIRPREGEGKLHYVDDIAVSPDGRRAAVCEAFEDRIQIFGPTETSPDEASLASVKSLAAHYGEHLSARGGLMTVLEPQAPSLLTFDLVKGRSDLVPINLHRLQRYGRGVGQLMAPSDTAIDEVHALVWVADPGNRRLSSYRHRWSREGELAQDPELLRLVHSLDLAGWHADGVDTPWPPTPIALEADAEGRLHALDARNGRIWRWTHAMEALPGFDLSALRRPTDLAFSPDGERCYVVDELGARVHVLDRDGAPVGAFGEGLLVRPFGVATDRDGDVYVTDSAAHVVQKLSPEGERIATWGRRGLGALEFYKPKGIALGPRGRLIVLDFGNHRLQLVTPDGEFLSAFGARLFTRPTRASAAKDDPPAEPEEKE